MIKKISVIILSILLIGCYSCLQRFYGTNVHGSLNIQIANSNLRSSYLEFYIDSVLNKNVAIPDSIISKFYRNNAQKGLYPEERLIHFKNYPGEWYLIFPEEIPFTIQSVLIEGSGYPVTELNEKEKVRIKQRFEKEILYSAELYAKNKKISDTIVYRNF